MAVPSASAARLRRRPGVLYISYDGMLEPLGQSQVISYLEKLAGDASLHLVSYEKPADWADKTKREAIAARLERSGIAWHPLTYHKTPTVPATLFDVGQGLAFGLWLTLRYNIRMVHARSYVSALIGWSMVLDWVEVMWLLQQEPCHATLRTASSFQSATCAMARGLSSSSIHSATARR